MTTPVLSGRRLHPEFGLEIAQVDLRGSLSDYVWEALRHALWEHSLLVFRHQPLSHADLARFARQIGPGQSAVKRFETSGPSPDQQWHAVGAIDGAPAIATVLCARAASGAGGSMEFASTRAVLAALPPEDVTLLEGVTATHVFRADSGRAIRHPLVVRQSYNGKPSLLMGYHVVTATGIGPMPPHLEPAALLSLATAPGRVHRHDFEQDDVVVWDNWSLMHRACALREGERRVLEEIAVLAG